jgi:hypothetical protein
MGRQIRPQERFDGASDALDRFGREDGTMSNSFDGHSGSLHGAGFGSLLGWPLVSIGGEPIGEVRLQLGLSWASRPGSTVAGVCIFSVGMEQALPAVPD